MQTVAWKKSQNSITELGKCVKWESNMRNGVPDFFAVVMSESCSVPAVPTSAFQLGLL